MRDKNQAGEFFLEISSSNSRRRICVIDIDSIEPMQGIKFKLIYHSKPNIYDKLSFKKDKTLKSEIYTSRHLAQIMDGLQQVLKLYEENERQLDMFVAKSAPAMEDVALDEHQLAAAQE